MLPAMSDAPESPAADAAVAAAPAEDPDANHPFAEERPFWVGVAMILSLTVVGLVLVFFAVRVVVPALFG